MTILRRTLLSAIATCIAGVARGREITPALAAFEQSSGGRVGLFVEDVKTNATIEWRANERFAMCSTFKLSLVACILARVDRREDHLDDIVSYDQADILSYAPVAKAHLPDGGLPVGALCQAAIGLSDNTCANLLLARIGGPSAVTRFWRTTGDAISRLDHNEPELNRTRPGDRADTTTPAAMAGNLRRFVLGEVLSAASREQLIAWMVSCETGGNLLRAGLPGNWRVGDKTGNNGSDVLADIAVAWPDPVSPMVICAYTQGGSPTQPQLQALLADIGTFAGQRTTQAD